MTPDNALLTQTQQDAAIVALFAYLIRKGQERRAREKEKPCRAGQGIQGNDAGASFASNHTPHVTQKSNEMAL